MEGFIAEFKFDSKKRMETPIFTVPAAGTKQTETLCETLTLPAVGYSN
jgi:hypothetical protein